MDHAPSTDQLREALATTGWLRSCPAPFAQALLAAGKVRRFQHGEMFNFAGDLEGGIWGIGHGQVGGFSGMNGPGAPMSLVMHPGEWGGLAPLFGTTRIGDCVARTPTAVLFVSLGAVRRLLAETPIWWEHFGALAFGIVRQYGSVAVDLQLTDSRQRMAAILLQAAGVRFRGELAEPLAIAQDELGQMANLSRHPAGEHLRAFAREGLISLGYRQLTLNDAAALRAIADGG